MKLALLAFDLRQQQPCGDSLRQYPFLAAYGATELADLVGNAFYPDAVRRSAACLLSNLESSTVKLAGPGNSTSEAGAGNPGFWLTALLARTKAANPGFF